MSVFDPLRTLAGRLDFSLLWWNRNGQKRVAVLAVMLIGAAVPWLLLGWLPQEWDAFVGGTALLLIPQMMASCR